MKKRRTKFSLNVYQILGMALLCVVLVMFTYNVTSSWFKDESITSNGGDIKIVGTLELDITTNFNFYNLALAPDTVYTEDKNGDDIGTYITVADEHNIDGAYVRVRYTCNRPELTLYFSPDNNNWVYNESDDFYYYLGYIGTTNTQFNAGYTVDNTLDNSKANADVSIELYFESIQRQYGASAAVWESSPQVFKTFVSSDENLVHNANGQ